MNRTITIDTRDHGPVTFTEPDWCTRGAHHDGSLPRRSELNHQGDAFIVTVATADGDTALLELALWQDVFPNPDWPMGDEVYALASLLDDDAIGCDTAALDQLADSMHDAARQIREFANRLALLQPRDGGQ